MTALTLVGVSWRRAPISVRERAALTGEHASALLSELVRDASIREAAVISTCNRTEIYVVAAESTAPLRRVLLDTWLRECGVDADTLDPFLFWKNTPDASAHIMRVAAGLDSQIRGETQVLGQVRGAAKLAQAAEAAGPVLNALFRHAIEAGRRTHTETELSRGAFSIGHATVDLASQVFADLSHARVLLVGAGDTSILTARHLIDRGVTQITVANRTLERAESLAESLGGTAVVFADVSRHLSATDILVTSTAAPQPIITRAMLAPVMRSRRGRPLFIIDVAVPRDVEEAAGKLDDVFLYNIDDLEACVAQDTRARESETADAERIAGEEAGRFLAWLETRAAAPVISGLRERLDAIRTADLKQLRARLSHLSDADWAAIETATLAMMNRVAREPILRLKQETVGKADRYDLMTAAREIFGLGPERGPAEANTLPDDAATAQELPLDPTR
ncbi:MAG: glutamyl-tRNA reductase [Armatimonadetes bacterium]|nr:glutamyl-tRNA reductase [Armatimonadota bacterium]MDE2205575.1 glutamyl-tRNA reductase [Armatimonadota bacterium]